MLVNEVSNILNLPIQYLLGCGSMLEEHEQTLGAIKRRELDIEILQLQLKHNLTKKRAESKLLIMYYKACNAISRAKLMVHGVNGNDVKAPDAPNPPAQIDPWDDRHQKRI